MAEITVGWIEEFTACQSLSREMISTILWIQLGTESHVSCNGIGDHLTFPLTPVQCIYNCHKNCIVILSWVVSHLSQSITVQV